MTEEWLPVRGYEGLYEVSNLGRIRSYHKWRGRGGIVPQLRKLYPQPKGYLQINLSKDGHQKWLLVHVLVAEAFIGPRPEGLEIDHIDTNKGNARVDNLEYVTRSENHRRAYRMGLVRKPSTNNGCG